jgi:hypothetical protein
VCGRDGEFVALETQQERIKFNIIDSAKASHVGRGPSSLLLFYFIF